MFELKGYLQTRRHAVNREIERFLNTLPYQSRVVEAMRYSVLAGGKRLRPILCIAASEAVGDGNATVVSASCALEFIHTYSLIHDDLPAMDDDQLRRGKPTCHVKFDESTAILAGDGLLTLAFEVLAGLGLRQSRSDRIWMKVIQILAYRAGVGGMVEGQMRDIGTQGTPLGLSQLKALHRLKTGALIDASVATGALLGGANAEQEQALRSYAGHMGLAFQVVDDLLNVKGDTRLTGKAVGSDCAKGKNTFPALMGTSASEKYVIGLRDQALQALECFDKKAAPLRAIAHYIIERNR
jgi:geranylgeranyl diphosphate synthase type II